MKKSSLYSIIIQFIIQLFLIHIAEFQTFQHIIRWEFS